MTEPWDVLIRGGTVVDPARGSHRREDVAFRDGRVAAVGEALPEQAREVLDARGALVVPGLIDLHAHVYDGAVPVGVHADRTSLVNGVTTVIDAGSAGWMTFAGFRDYVIPTYRTRVLAFLHVGATGLAINRVMPELAAIRFAQPEETARVVSENPGLLLGVKVRIAHGGTGHGDPANAREALRRARKAADLARVPLMVHVSGSPIPLTEILDHCAPGDIVTHVFHGHREGVLGPDGRVRREVRAAAARGVVLDVGHASVHFDVRVARAAIADGLPPTTVSTDLHAPPPGRVVYHLRGLMSKFLALGLPLDEVVASVTSRPAAALGLSGTLGSIADGLSGDAAVMDLEEGRFLFRDAAANEVTATRRFKIRHVVRDGRRVPLPERDADHIG
jgi:dihydroorotase